MGLLHRNDNRLFSNGDEPSYLVGVRRSDIGGSGQMIGSDDVYLYTQSRILLSYILVYGARLGGITDFWCGPLKGLLSREVGV